MRTDIALQSSFYALGKSPGRNLLTYIIHYSLSASASSLLHKKGSSFHYRALFLSTTKGRI